MYTIQRYNGFNINGTGYMVKIPIKSSKYPGMHSVRRAAYFI